MGITHAVRFSGHSPLSFPESFLNAKMPRLAVGLAIAAMRPLYFIPSKKVVRAILRRFYVCRKLYARMSLIDLTVDGLFVATSNAELRGATFLGPPETVILGPMTAYGTQLFQHSATFSNTAFFEAPVRCSSSFHATSNVVVEGTISHQSFTAAADTVRCVQPFYATSNATFAGGLDVLGNAVITGNVHVQGTLYASDTHPTFDNLSASNFLLPVDGEIVFGFGDRLRISQERIQGINELNVIQFEVTSNLHVGQNIRLTSLEWGSALSNVGGVSALDVDVGSSLRVGPGILLSASAGETVLGGIGAMNASEIAVASNLRVGYAPGGGAACLLAASADGTATLSNLRALSVDDAAVVTSNLCVGRNIALSSQDGGTTLSNVGGIGARDIEVTSNLRVGPNIVLSASVGETTIGNIGTLSMSTLEASAGVNVGQNIALSSLDGGTTLSNVGGVSATYLNASNIHATGMSASNVNVHAMEASNVRVGNSIVVHDPYGSNIISGCLAVGASSNPEYPLHVFSSKNNISIFCDADVVSLSDSRLKSNILRINDALDKVTLLNGYTFLKDGERGCGLLAQDLRNVLPEAVREHPDTGVLSVAYGNVVSLLINAVNDLRARVERMGG
jgi:hypothetical protein